MAQEKKSFKLAGGFDPAGVAVVVDSNGHLQASFVGIDSKIDAESHKRLCDRANMRHMHGSSVVTGDEAKKAIRLDKEGKKL